MYKQTTSALLSLSAFNSGHATDGRENIRAQINANDKRHTVAVIEKPVQHEQTEIPVRLKHMGEWLSLQSLNHLHRVAMPELPRFLLINVLTPAYMRCSSCGSLQISGMIVPSQSGIYTRFYFIVEILVSFPARLNQLSSGLGFERHWSLLLLLILCASVNVASLHTKRYSK